MKHPALATVPQSLVQSDILSVDLQPEPLAAAVIKRYGLLQLPFVVDTDGLNLEDLTSIEKMLGAVNRSEQVPVDSTYRWQVFFTSLLRNTQLPSGICDIVPPSPDVLSLCRPGFKVRLQRVSSSCYLFDSLEDNDVSWTLLLPSATTTLEILRSAWGPSNKDVAVELLRRGIPFHTVDNVSSVSRPILSYNLTPGLYPYGYQTTTLDYKLYALERERLLRGPRGRAALLKGGIVWRIAMDVLQDSEALDGPQGYDGPCFQLAHDGGFLVDDDLSADELAIICGVYRILTRKYMATFTQVLI